MNSTQVHVVFGAGQIGTLVAEQLLALGHSVRLVRRGAPGAARPGLTWLQGDVTDHAFAERAAQGANVIYHCTAAPYDQWHEVFPKLDRGVRHAAARSGAKLVVLDNLYMYGRVSALPFDESTPMAPCSRKGALRAKLVEEMFEAHARGEIRVTMGRADNFVGPDTIRATVFGDRFYQRIYAGKAAQFFGDPDLLHTFSYTPDVARGLVTLGLRDESIGRAWHLPVAAAESTTALCARFENALGVPVRITRVPDLVLRAFGIFQPVIREVAEMTYQWKSPFVLDDTAFRQTFGYGATPFDVSIPATADWARKTFGPAAEGQPSVVAA